MANLLSGHSCGAEFKQLPHSQSSISLVRYLQTFLKTDEERHIEQPVVPTTFLLPKNDILMSGTSMIHQNLKYAAFRYKLPFTLRYHTKKIHNNKKIRHCFRTMPKPKSHQRDHHLRPSTSPQSDPNSALFFYLPQEKPNGIFCQWYPSAFTVLTAALTGSASEVFYIQYQYEGVLILILNRQPILNILLNIEY